MNFRMASKDDIKDIMKIIKQAQDYLKGQGVDQWQNGYPNEAVIREDIDKGYTYVGLDDGKIVATAAVSFDEEETYKTIYDGDWLSHRRYAVIHRIAVDNEKKGKGAAAEIINMVVKLCAARNIKSIKIDTHEDNKSMQRMLLKNGFKYCGVIYLKDGAKRIAFEKLLAQHTLDFKYI